MNQKANIFISYRRADTAGHTGRLYDRLNHHFSGQAKIFMDLDTLAPGEDAVTSIETAVGSCDALIVMIGDQWVSVKGVDGNLRLHQPEDYVRNEIAVALKRNILVIPILVEGAPMPQAKDLPSDLVKLVRLNALEISDGRWEHDTQRLIERLEQELGVRGLVAASQTDSPRPIWKRPLAIGAAILVLLCLTLLGRMLFRPATPSVPVPVSPLASKDAMPDNAGGKGQTAINSRPPSADEGNTAAIPTNPSSDLRLDPKVINLLAAENGGKLLIASTDRWKNTIDGKEGSSGYFDKGAFAVFGFKEEKLATLEAFAVYVPGTSGTNLKDFELLVNSESPDGKFESLGKFQLKNYRVVEDPFQKIALPNVKAKYLKIVILSNHEGSTVAPYIYEMRLLGRLD